MGFHFVKTAIKIGSNLLSYKINTNEHKHRIRNLKISSKVRENAIRNMKQIDRQNKLYNQSIEQYLMCGLVYQEGWEQHIRGGATLTHTHKKIIFNHSHCMISDELYFFLFVQYHQPS